ncbi:MAG: hypothetical protein ACFE0I_04705 [Elainellaceae cyanobacterium]
MQQKFFLKSRVQIGLVSLVLLPLGLVIGLIATNGVNIPVSDEWLILGVAEKIHSGTLTVSDLFAQHHEHRLVFPKLIFAALAFATSWNVKAEMYLSACLALITVALTIYLSRFSSSTDKNSLFLVVVLNAWLIFSFAQYANWLWGFQFPWFLINACLIGAVCLVALSRDSPNQFYWAAIPCFVASFSIAHGLLTWLALFPSIFALKGNNRKTLIRCAIWGLLFLGTLAIYLIDFQGTGDFENLPSPTYVFEEPIKTLQYFFNLIGSPLTGFPATKLLPFIGLAVFLSFLFLTIRSMRLTRFGFDISERAAPWISIGLFALLFAGVTTIGRAGFGADQAVAPRYVTPTLLLVVAIANLWRIRFSFNSFLFTSGILVAFLINSTNQSLLWIPGWHSQRQTEKECFELVHFIDLPHHCPTPLSEHSETLAANLETLGFRDFPETAQFISNPDKIHGDWNVDRSHSNETDPNERKRLILARNEELQVSGWAILPERREIPSLILLSYGRRRKPNFFMSSSIDKPSPEAVKAYDSERYSNAGWKTTISLSALPPGKTAIRAWVYDPDIKGFVGLNGKLKLNILDE